ncbi:hypothetical protein [Streptomyces sp. 8N616]|uniref:hypothetical protein n=1 Tax=Streptomyces sp. 8N616 TaxID=3457414 RepID=UPI003FD01923
MTLSIPVMTLYQVARRAGIPLLMLCAGAGGAHAVTELTPPTYESKASILLISNVSASKERTPMPYPGTTQTLVPTVVRLGESDTVARATAAATRLPAELVSGHIDADAQPDVQIVTLTASAGTGARSATIANAAARAVSAHLERRPLSADGSIKAQPLDEAAPPRRPVTPDPLLNGALGSLLGLLTGMGVVSLRDRLDDRMYSTVEIESELGALSLAVVPRLSHRLRRRGARMAYQRADIADSIRTAVATLAAVPPAQTCQRLLVTGVSSDDGDAVPAVLLALGMTEQHERVTLVEGELHRPTVARHFPEAHRQTLQELLDADGALSPQPVITSDRLCVVPAEPTDPQCSAALFRSKAFEKVLAHIADRNDVMLVHAPPLLGNADAAALARHTDAVILVVRAGATRARHAHRALHLLRKIGTPIAGILILDSTSGEAHAKGGAAGPLATAPGHLPSRLLRPAFHGAHATERSDDPATRNGAGPLSPHSPEGTLS